MQNVVNKAFSLLLAVVLALGCAPYGALVYTASAWAD